MKRPVISVLLCTLAMSASAKDVFTINAHSTGEAKLSLRVSGDGNGYFREADNYGPSGNAYDLGTVKCGSTTRWFEVWSQRNFSTSNPPGFPSGKVHGDFSVAGGGVQVEKTVNATLKRASHWKDQDFGVTINLSCGN